MKAVRGMLRRSAESGAWFKPVVITVVAVATALLFVQLVVALVAALLALALLVWVTWWALGLRLSVPPSARAAWLAWRARWGLSTRADR